MAKILVVGGAGYVGSVLVPRLIDRGHAVTVLDTFWYWQDEKEFSEAVSDKALLVRDDIRDFSAIDRAVKGQDFVISLACISNDPCSDIDPTFTHEVNYNGNLNVLDATSCHGAKLIYVSSSSVYGIKDTPNVTEDMPLKPLTQYSELKVEVEHYMGYLVKKGKLGAIAVRPATVAGYSPRMRLDLSLNMFVDFAVNKGKIKVFGGQQQRPFIHIQDMTALYELLLGVNFDFLNGSCYNAGGENYTIAELAALVQSVVPTEIERVPVTDNRSYHICSDKLRRELGFVPKHTALDAVHDVVKAFREGKVPEGPICYNVQMMKKLLSRRTCDPDRHPQG